MDVNTNQTDYENLSSYFQRSATIVRQYADLRVIEQDYAQPILRYSSLKFKERPVTMTFLTVFVGLSILPVLSFAGLTVFTFSSIVFVAVISGAIAFITIEAVLVVCLASVLWLLFIIASFATAAVVFVYCTTRLGVLFTYEGPTGIANWAYETRQHIFHAKRQEESEESDESAILVDRDRQGSKKVKAEEESPLNN